MASTTKISENLNKIPVSLMNTQSAQIQEKRKNKKKQEFLIPTAVGNINLTMSLEGSCLHDICFAGQRKNTIIGESPGNRHQLFHPTTETTIVGFLMCFKAIVSSNTAISI